MRAYNLGFMAIAAICLLAISFAAKPVSAKMLLKPPTLTIDLKGYPGGGGDGAPFDPATMPSEVLVIVLDESTTNRGYPLANEHIIATKTIELIDVGKRGVHNDKMTWPAGGPTTHKSNATDHDLLIKTTDCKTGDSPTSNRSSPLAGMPLGKIAYRLPDIGLGPLGTSAPAFTG